MILPTVQSKFKRGFEISDFKASFLNIHRAFGVKYLFVEM